MVKESILPMSNVHKPRIQIGHDFSDATDINVAHGVLHISAISVQLYELPVFEKGVDAFDLKPTIDAVQTIGGAVATLLTSMRGLAEGLGETRLALELAPVSRLLSTRSRT